MSQIGPLTQENMRLLPLQAQLPRINGFPTNIGIIPCTSTTVAVSNDDSVANFELYAGQYVHLQANAPCYLGAGFTPALAKANAIAISKRVDAWEPWETFLPGPSDNPTGATLIPVSAGTPGQFKVYLAVVLQSSGSVNLYVGRVK